ncbi:MAG: peptide-methionine (S)-S-oxide reductase MsrA [Candidatus Marinimicrobia bacterium]|nr:peptide-methionine (S)-S-oxide reductase MsrA [Candidatus Neomarinimicrobiota bacterium]
MNYGCNKRLIPVYFIGIILGFILAEIEKNINLNIEQATFGAGCFWCVEAVFQDIEGVLDVRAGYTGGSTDNPTYEDICTGKTGHAEVIQIDFDSTIISYEKLLDIFWKSHDPTTLNRQGADTGTQYRSAIYFHSESQKKVALQSKNSTDKIKLYSDPIVTEITPSTKFYIAENYHQDYYRINKNAPYCQLVIKPKLEKLKINK